MRRFERLFTKYERGKCRLGGKGGLFECIRREGKEDGEAVGDCDSCS